MFHADDVFATALLKILSPDVEVARSNVVPDGFDGIVYDIGGGEFDHSIGRNGMEARRTQSASTGPRE